MNAVRNWIRHWTGGQFFVFTLAVVMLWFVSFTLFRAQPDAPAGYSPLYLWGSLALWFVVAWIWFGRKRND